jgi:hypothetical protein
MIVDTMTGDNSDTTLTLSVAPVSENNVQVYFDGVYQSKANYSISGTTLTFSTAPATGVAVEAITHTQTTINEPANGTVTSSKLSGDLTTPGNLDVTGTFTSTGIDDNATSTAITIDSSENVGIGVTPSSWSSSVYKGLQIGTGIGVGGIIGRVDGTNSINLGLNWYYGGGATNTYIDSAAATNYSQEAGTHRWFYAASGTAGGALTFSESMRIDSSGNVGIGETSPNYLLDVNEIGRNSTGEVLLTAGNASSNDYTQSTLLRLRATSINPNSTAHNINGAVAEIRFDHTDLPGSASSGTMTFHTNPGNNIAGALAERMRIDSSGNLLVGTTSNSYLNKGYKLRLDDGLGAYSLYGATGTGAYSFLQFSRGTDGSLGFVGTITTTGSSTAYNTSSDYRLKENVVTDWDATTRLKQLRPSRFNFIADPDTTVDGFLAHEVQDIVPEAITGVKDEMQEEEYEVTPAVLDEDGNVVTEAVMGTREVPKYQGIDQSKLVPLLVKTIQELEARITTLENA